MNAPKTHLRTLAIAAAIAAATSLGAAVTACSSDDSAPAKAAVLDAGGTTPDAGGGGGGDAGDGGTSTTLYERLGKRAGIAKAVDAIVAEELKDPEIASYFFFQASAPGNGHPTADQVKLCLTFQLSNASGGAEAYPPAPSETGGFTCRNMKASHAELHIPDSVFTKFLTIAGGVLQSAGVAKGDIDVIASVLDGFRSSIVDPAKDGGPFVPPGDGG